MPPADVLVRILALRSSKGTVNREIILQVTIPAVDSFFLKEHIYIQTLQLPEDLEHFPRIPSELADGFYQDHVDLTLMVTVQKSLKFLGQHLVDCLPAPLRFSVGEGIYC